MSGSRENVFTLVYKDFSGTDIYHSDIKNAFVLRYCKSFFLLTKNYFSKFAKFFKTKCF